MQINSPSILSLAFILALTPPTISHPIQTSKWVKIEQFQDPNDRGIWKVFEKEGYHDQLPDPPHVKYHGVSIMYGILYCRGDLPISTYRTHHGPTKTTN